MTSNLIKPQFIQQVFVGCPPMSSKWNTLYSWNQPVSLVPKYIFKQCLFLCKLNVHIPFISLCGRFVARAIAIFLGLLSTIVYRKCEQEQIIDSVCGCFSWICHKRNPNITILKSKAWFLLIPGFQQSCHLFVTCWSDDIEWQNRYSTIIFNT